MTAVSPRKKRRFSFHGYFSALLSSSIVLAALLFVVYGYLPAQYYLPISFLFIAIFGIMAFVILNKKIAF